MSEKKKLKRVKIYEYEGRELREDSSEYASLPEETKKMIEPAKDIEITKEDEWTTRKSVLEYVAKRWDKPIPKTDAEIETFIEDFAKMSHLERIQFGLWGEGTPERECQKLIEGGMTPEEAYAQIFGAEAS